MFRFDGSPADKRMVAFRALALRHPAVWIPAIPAGMTIYITNFNIAMPIATITPPITRNWPGSS